MDAAGECFVYDEVMERINGTDAFLLDSVASVNLPIVGTLTNGHFAGCPDAAQIWIFYWIKWLRLI
jgi:hypothetical protein